MQHERIGGHERPDVDLIVQITRSAQIITARDQINRIVVVLFVPFASQITKLFIRVVARIEQLVRLELNVVLLPVDYFVNKVVFAYVSAHSRRAAAVVGLEAFIA
jgi:hypothetical protein